VNESYKNVTTKPHAYIVRRFLQGFRDSHRLCIFGRDPLGNPDVTSRRQSMNLELYCVSSQGVPEHAGLTAGWSVTAGLSHTRDLG
jgi:hypothetical protein